MKKAQKGFTIAEGRILTVIGFVLIALIIAAIGSVKNREFEGNIAPKSSTPAEKPFTKTRCDFSGFQSASIINEEAKRGYQFTGRISTPQCGDNGLSFQLREQQ